MDRPHDGHYAGGLIAGLLSRCRFPIGDLDAAVSGGPDSLALLVLAVAAAERTGQKVTAIHVDHGLRPGSAADADMVAAAAARLGTGFESRQLSVSAGPNLEARARTARYAALPAGVLTGHTADDQAETVLLNLIRGAALDGLSGMASHARVRRPLLGLRRAETAALCANVGLVAIADPTNDDHRFRRNQVRQRLLPLLAEISDRDPVPVLARQADLLRDDADLLEVLATAIDPTDARALRVAPAPLARRAVRRWLRLADRSEGHPPSSAEVARVLAVAAGEVVGCELAGGRMVRRSGGRLQIFEAAGPANGSPAPPPGRVGPL